METGNAKQLQSFLDQVNELLNCDMTLDYNAIFGGYMLAAVPREYRFLQSTRRVSKQEMTAFLYGVLCGMRLSQPQKNI